MGTQCSAGLDCHGTYLARGAIRPLHVASALLGTLATGQESRAARPAEPVASEWVGEKGTEGLRRHNNTGHPSPATHWPEGSKLCTHTMKCAPEHGGRKSDRAERKVTAQ